LLIKVTKRDVVIAPKLDRLFRSASTLSETVAAEGHKISHEGVAGVLRAKGSFKDGDHLRTA
jgi:hypothetical protein